MSHPLRWFAASLIATLAGAAAARADDPPRDLDRAIDAGLERIKAGALNYTTKRECFSCHHQALPVLVLTEAKRAGRKIDKAEIDRQVEFTAKSFQEHQNELAEGGTIGGGSHTVGYGLLLFQAAEYSPDDLTAAMVQYLLRRQRNDGSWKVSANRPPAEASSIGTTAVAIRGLRDFGPKALEKDKNGAEQIAAAIEKGKTWLIDTAKPEETEDHVFRLFGLVWAGAKQDAIDQAKKHLLKLQRDDGGWAQLPDGKSDAYATGTALVALRKAGLPSDDEAFTKGIAYLLKTQDKTGAWIVNTRSRPFQTFFDNGDPPRDKNQFISFTATNWALLALLEAFAAEVK